jgi:RNA polymerase sigma-70 factor (ECF subfamily)
LIFTCCHPALALDARIALHCQAPTFAETDWAQIVALYGVLERVEPSPVVSLNRAAAVAMLQGPRAALFLIDALTPRLEHYYLLHSARADLLRRLGNRADAAKSYGRALELATNDAARRFLQRRLDELG